MAKRIKAIFVCHYCKHETKPITGMSLFGKRCSCGAYDWRRKDGTNV